MRSLTFLAGLGAALVATATVAQPVRTIPLPVEMRFPEGIGLDRDGAIYTAGSIDGTVVRTDPRSGRSTVLSAAGALLPPATDTLPRMLGIKVDDERRLWIAGGRTGRVFVLGSRDGKRLKEMTVSGEGSQLNDLVVTPGGVFVTDTRRPILWRVSPSRRGIGELTPWLALDGTVIPYGTGRNLNGIAASADGKSLIVVHMDKGLLFRIDVATKTINPIEVPGEDLTNGDGLYLDGSMLYLVRQAEAEIVTLQLAPDLASGRVVSRFRDPAILWPATAVKVGDELLVVSSQFNKRATGDPVTPFTVAAIPLSALAPQR